MSKHDIADVANTVSPSGQRWLIPMDFSIQAMAGLSWVQEIMKEDDFLLILSVLNLKTPVYIHDTAANDRILRESQEKLSYMVAETKEKGYRFVKCLCVRGDPAKIYAENEEIDTIVMGRRGINSVERLIYGSVSSYVLKHVECAICIMGAAVEKRVTDERSFRHYSVGSERTPSSSESDFDRQSFQFLQRNAVQKDI